MPLASAEYVYLVAKYNFNFMKGKKRFQFHEVLVVNCSQCLGCQCSVHKVFACANELKKIIHFLFYQIQCISPCVEVSDTFGVELWSEGYIWVYLHSSVCNHPVWPAPFGEDTVFFQCISGFFIKNQVSIAVWTYVRVYNLILLITVSGLESKQWFLLLLFYYSVVQFEIRHGDTSSNTSIIQDGFSYPALAVKLMLKVFLSSSVKNCVVVLMWIALNLYIAVGRMAIFIALILPTRDLSIV